MRILSKVLLACLCTVMLLLSGCGKSDELTVVFPKLGSADSALLMTDEITILIDTGEKNDGDELLELLQAYGRDTIDLLVLSHYDKDHVGGAAEIISGCTVKRIIGSTSPKDSDEMAAYRAALETNGLTEEVPTSPLSVTLGGLDLVIDPPQERTYAEDQSNNSSMVVSVHYHDSHLLFTGDAMSERTSEFASKLKKESFDFIKIPHHGRDADTVSQLLPAMKSRAAAIITSSKKEPEKQAVLDALGESNITPYLTRQGTVVVISDGKTLKISQET